MATDPGDGIYPTMARKRGKLSLTPELSPGEVVRAGKYYGAHTAGVGATRFCLFGYEARPFWRVSRPILPTPVPLHALILVAALLCAR